MLLLKLRFFPLFISQIPQIHLAEVGSNTVRDVKQRILLVDLGEWFGYNHQMTLVEHNHQMALVVLSRSGVHLCFFRSKDCFQFVHLSYGKYTFPPI